MKVGYILPQSLIDYPGKVSAIFFTVGCNFKCPYCYNPNLASGEIDSLSEEEIENFLKEREDFLDAILLSGGEPTLQKDVLDFAKKVKSRGFLFGIETNGTNPAVLKKLIDQGLVDFMAMDVKAGLDNYEKVSGVEADKEKIEESIELIKNSGLDHEFRTTVVSSFIDEETIRKIGKLIKGSRIVLQQFVNDKDMFDDSFKEVEPYKTKKLKEFKEILEDYASEVEVRT